MLPRTAVRYVIIKESTPMIKDTHGVRFDKKPRTAVRYVIIKVSTPMIKDTHGVRFDKKPKSAIPRSKIAAVDDVDCDWSVF